MYNGIRHFVFVIPPLAVLGGLAGRWIGANGSRAGRPALVAAAAVLLAGLAPPVVEMVRLHPYEYTHFNRSPVAFAAPTGATCSTTGASPSNRPRSELRASSPRAARQPPRGRHGRSPSAGRIRRPRSRSADQFEPTWDPKGADFAMMLGEFYCAKLDAPVLVEITREGVVFARVYDIRGRSIPSLFTVRRSDHSSALTPPRARTPNRARAPCDRAGRAAANDRRCG